MNWRRERLGDLCEFRRGLTYSKSDEVQSSSNIVLRATNLDLATGSLDLSELRYISDAVEVPSDRKVRKDALLICMASGSRSHLGKVAIIQDEYNMAFGGFLGQMRPGSRVVPKWLYYVLRSQAYNEHLSKLAPGTNINNLKFDDIADFAILLPPLPEQQRIVTILDKAFEAIAAAEKNAEKNRDNADVISQRYTGIAFRDAGKENPSVPLGSVCERVTVGHVGPMADEYKVTGIPFLRSQNIRPFRLDLNDVKYIAQAFDDQLQKSRLAPGDVAIVRTGYPGTATVIPANLGKANCADLVIARPGPRLNSNYLAAFLNSDPGKLLVGGNLNGAAQKHFNVGSAKQALIPLPSLKDQTRIAAAIREFREESEKLKHTYTRKLALLAELRQSLLARAFSGELTASSSLAA